MALMSQVGLEFIARNRANPEMMRFNRSLTTMRGSLLKIVGLAGGIYGVRRALKSLTDAYIVQERAEMALAAALRNSGSEVRQNLKSMKLFAAEMQRQTIYGDELIISQMAYARNLGVVTEQLQDATKAAIGLAAKYRLDLATAMMLVGRASQGQTQMLTRYGIVLAETLSSQEKFAEVLRIGADAFSLAQDEAKTLGGRLEQQKNRWGDIKEAIAGEGGVVDAYEDLLNVVEQNQNVWTEFYADQIGGLAEITSGFKGLRTIFRQTFLGADSPFRSGGSGPAKPPRSYQQEARERAFQRMTDAQKAAVLGSLFGTPEERLAAWSAGTGPSPPPTAGGGGGGLVGPPVPSDIESRQSQWNQSIIDSTRDVQQFIRNQNYMTRNERIQYLKDYMTANADTLGKVAEANKILHDEILLLESSRLDQMKIYFAEMRENAQSAYLFQMEVAAEYNRQVRDDFGRMWDPFIEGSMSAEEAMKDFFQNLFLNLAKAQAQMAMMQLWDAAIGPAFGGLTKGLFGVAMHAGGVVGTDGVGRMVSSAAFRGASRYHNGLAADEIPAILQRGETVKPAGAGADIQIGTYIERVDATDQASFEGQLYRSRQALGDLSVMSDRSNHPTRRGGRE